MPDIHRCGRGLHHRSPGGQSAQRLDKITFDEMLEMASQGSKILQIRSVEFAGKYNVPLRVMSSFEEGPGTLISLEDDDQMEKAVVSGIAFNRDEAKLTIRGIPDQPGVAYKVLGAISAANIEIDVIVQNVAKDNSATITFTVHRNDLTQAEKLLKADCYRPGCSGSGFRRPNCQGVYCGRRYALPCRCGIAHV